jgi:hypothetical protein
MQQHKRHDTDRLFVRYDAESHAVTVSFQGQSRVLPQTFATYDEGMIAGYSYARAQGWQNL